MSSQMWNLVLVGGVVVVGYFVYVNWGTIFPEISAIASGIAGEVRDFGSTLSDTDDNPQTPSNTVMGTGKIVIPTPPGKPVPACPAGTVTTVAGCARARTYTPVTRVVPFSGTPPKVCKSPLVLRSGSCMCPAARPVFANGVCSPAKGTCPPGMIKNSGGGCTAAGRSAYTKRVAYLAETYKSIYPRMSLMP